MNIPANLRKIADDLGRAVREEEIDRSAIDLAAIRIGTQAELLEMGLDKLEEGE